MTGRVYKWSTACVAAAMCLAVAARSHAHEGPPFPVLLDEPAGELQVSVWADPDIGDATFYIILETRSGEPPAQEPVVTLWTEPVSGRLERVSYETTRQSLRKRMQFECRPHFDRRDLWNVGFRLHTAGTEATELTIEIESTPPGFGAWDLAIYLFPFALLGGLWIMAMVKQIKKRRLQALRRREEGECPP